MNGSVPYITGPLSVAFAVNLSAAPTHVRYTANQGFPQCAVVDSAGLPGYPFLLPVDPHPLRHGPEQS